MLLLDTNIVSYAYKQHSIWNSYFPMTLGRELFLSFQTIAELTEGSIVANWSMLRRSKLEVFLKPYSVLQSTPNMCSWWAYVRAHRQSQPISVSDAWIAATALCFDLELVTHNPKDFQGIRGLRIISAIR